MNVVVTGGAGYVGSHTALELVLAGHRVRVVDDLSNGSRDAVERIEALTGTGVPLDVLDLRDVARLDALLAGLAVDAVVHCAGLKAVAESVPDPLRYYRTNIDSTLALLEAMHRHGVRRMVFSSSATVYGSAPVPYVETAATGHGIASPYGRTKHMIEEILRDTAAANPEDGFAVLRYFNPVGAHPSGLLGERPTGGTNNLLPRAVAAAERGETLTVFGADYDTPDGTAVRDYVHVVDVARAHVRALDHDAPGVRTFNLGTGRGASVLEVVRAVERACGHRIRRRMAPRRPGDLPEYYADATRARDLLGWRAERTLDDACRDAWRWQCRSRRTHAAAVTATARRRSPGA